MNSLSEHLHFEPYDTHLWKTDCDLYLGRPGEEVYVNPPQVLKVLSDIKSGIKSPFYSLRVDGKYDVWIPQYKIKGVASWR